MENKCNNGSVLIDILERKDIVEDLQTKVQKGLSSFQKGIENGKSKLRISQELISLKDEVKNLEDLRTSCVLELGELSYMQIRNKNVDEEVVTKTGNKILELDKKIFKLLQEIEERTKKGEETTCECGASVTASDKFCRKCGKKVEIQGNDIVEKTIVCNHCKATIPATYKYCNCCGIKINK